MSTEVFYIFLLLLIFINDLAFCSVVIFLGLIKELLVVWFPLTFYMSPEFILEMFAIEFRTLDTSDLGDKLDQLFGGLPPKAMVLVLPLLHISLEKYIKGKAGR